VPWAKKILCSQKDEESCLHSSCLLPAENGYRTLIKSIPGSVQSRNINFARGFARGLACAFANGITFTK